MKIEVLALTTTDNPFNPLEDWDNWYRYDCDHGYQTCEYLARSCIVAETNSLLEQIQTQNQAVEDIVRINATGYWKKVSKIEDIET